MNKVRNDGRLLNQPRALKMMPDFTKHAEGSVLIETGETKVICTASVEEKVPPFLKGKGTGWVSGEYSMLPRSTSTRVNRERSKVGGRTQEIQRLIGRSLRSVVNLKLLGERTIWIDCDVIQADGGTRTASITGGYVALVLALKHLQNQGIVFEKFPVEKQLAAISLGIINDEVLLDLNYLEDSNADVDMNVIMTHDMKIVEIQGTAEKATFSRKKMNEMLDLAESGLNIHFEGQLQALGGKIN
ncbi:MAG: ribonuclease PH [Deltaproteobacteria bacterium]|mgnify:CR=1 FL=1|jgi:ribonuclease PH|nr:ribonuclease PH [Deltaproteobacteria bacterium]MBT4527491.1 ribonuclease PH [Deltaproteobacteria bacterium]